MFKLPRREKPDAEWRSDSAVAISAKTHARLKVLARESGLTMKTILALLVEQAEVDPSKKKESK